MTLNTTHDTTHGEGLDEAILQAVEQAARIPAEQGRVDTDASWQSLSAMMEPEVSAQVRRPRYAGIMASVGGFVLLIIIAIGIKYIPTRTTPPLQIKTYTTTFAQRATITLSDGSSVILAPGTTLQANGRHITLTGQAAFTVTQNNDRPFTVTTGNTTARVLGTTFNVRHYTTDNTTRITVALGKVAVANDVLSVGDRIQVLGNGTKQLTRGVDISRELGWTSGKLVLDEEHFRDAIPDLERWYGIKVRASSTLLNRSVRAELQTESVQEAMEILAFTLRAHIERSGKTINFIAE